MTGITIIDPEEISNCSLKTVEIYRLVNNNLEGIICEEPDYSSWWFEQKLNYLRLLYYLPSLSPIVICRCPDKRIICYRGLNQLLTLRDFMGGSLKIPSNLFNITEKPNEEWITFDDLPFQDKLRFTSENGVRILEYCNSNYLSGELFKDL